LLAVELPLGVAAGGEYLLPGGAGLPRLPQGLVHWVSRGNSQPYKDKTNTVEDNAKSLNLFVLKVTWKGNFAAAVYLLEAPSTPRFLY
jgi:hypothetical protein